MDSIAEETAQLMEFKFDTVNELKETNVKMNKVELIISSNWNDIVQLKFAR